MLKYRTKDSLELTVSLLPDDYSKSHLELLRKLVISEKVYSWESLAEALGFGI